MHDTAAKNQSPTPLDCFVSNYQLKRSHLGNDLAAPTHKRQRRSKDFHQDATATGLCPVGNTILQCSSERRVATNENDLLHNVPQASNTAVLQQSQESDPPGVLQQSQQSDPPGNEADHRRMQQHSPNGGFQNSMDLPVSPIGQDSRVYV